MLAAMSHRGPDDCGMVTLPAPNNLGSPAILLHARLSILDLTQAGHQPMADQPPLPGAKPNWIIFNGEIYNFLQLRESLSCRGWPCRTRCDTEVILHAYRLWGENCVERLRGMFAWCLADSERGIVWFCRDRLGIKPLYLARPTSGGLLFASEIRTLLAAGPDLVPPKASASAVEGFLAQGAVYGHESIIEGVESLPPGQSLVTDWSGKSLKTRTYWQVPFVSPERKESGLPALADRQGVVRDLATTIREAVKLHMVSDVPLGVFLSGGIDSTALATLATEVAETKVRTISIGFDQDEFDESNTAAATALALQTEHHVIRLTGRDVLEMLPDALSAFDQPTVDGFNTYFVSQAARRLGLKVSLSGLGGDEIFGGYASFRDVPRAVRWRKRLRKLGPARQLLAAIVDRTGGRWGIKAAESLRRRPAPLSMYLLRRELFLPRDRRALHPVPAGIEPSNGIPRTALADMRELAATLDPVNQVSLFELSGYMRYMLLRDADVFSMAHGLEVRVPLLDHEVVEQVARLPGEFKRPDPRPKPLLIDAVGERMPAPVVQMPKRGFTFPWGAWLRGPLRERASRAIENRALWAGLGFNSEAPRAIWQRFLSGDNRVAALQVLGLVVLESFASRHGLRRAA
jgi:asparagine synthase (glutamine-hydrolysing)